MQENCDCEEPLRHNRKYQQASNEHRLTTSDSLRTSALQRISADRALLPEDRHICQTPAYPVTAVPHIQYIHDGRYFTQSHAFHSVNPLPSVSILFWATWALTLRNVIPRILTGWLCRLVPIACTIPASS